MSQPVTASNGPPPLDLANALRSLAVIKDTEALRVAKLAHRKGDRDRAREWLRIASAAAEASGDDELSQRVRRAGEEMER